MLIDRDTLLQALPIVVEQSFSRRDTILYALGVGATELDYVYEDGLKALPSMAVVLANPGSIWRDPTYGFDWQKILHGEQRLSIHRPLPVDGTVRGETEFEELIDKGPDNGAIAHLTRRLYNSEHEPLATVRSAIFLRGDGGCGGPSQAAYAPHATPETRAPDFTISKQTAETQAMIYRLSGDFNPLHIDPKVAQAAGFDRPILHGLATYGVICRSVVQHLLNNDPERLKTLDVRFSAPVYPGETIEIDCWLEASNEVSFIARAKERDIVVVKNGFAEYTE